MEWSTWSVLAETMKREKPVGRIGVDWRIMLK
jgi:hypothetical protein